MSHPYIAHLHKIIFLVKTDSSDVTPGFERQPGSATGIQFTNQLAEVRSIANRNLLSGSGVAAGDVDGDGWCDLYFCSLDGDNALYRNLGGWRFEKDVILPEAAGLESGVIADFDGDALPDLYVEQLTAATSFRYDRAEAFVDVDPRFYAARYLRAWQLQSLITETLVERYDVDWWRNPRAGPWITQALFGEAPDARVYSLRHADDAEGVELVDPLLERTAQPRSRGLRAGLHREHAPVRERHLADAGRHADAEACFRAAAEAGDTVASFNLGSHGYDEARGRAPREGAAEPCAFSGESRWREASTTGWRRPDPASRQSRPPRTSAG